MRAKSVRQIRKPKQITHKHTETDRDRDRDRDRQNLDKLAGRGREKRELRYCVSVQKPAVTLHTKKK